jgi:hypothetical protein
MHTKFLKKNLDDSNHLEYLGVDDTIILKQNFKETEGNLSTGIQGII